MPRQVVKPLSASWKHWWYAEYTELINANVYTQQSWHLILGNTKSVSGLRTGQFSPDCVTSEMIHHCGVSLSKQQTAASLICRICHCLLLHQCKRPNSMSAKVGKSSPETAMVSHMSTVGTATVASYTCMNYALHWSKSWAEYLPFMSAVCAWPLPGVTLTINVTEICTPGEQPAVDDP